MSQEIIERLTRIETKTDALLDHKADQEKRIRSLEKKWYTSIGALFIALATFFKSLFHL